MKKRQQSKRVKRTCLACKTTFDPARYKVGCPTCSRERMQRLFKDISLGRRR